MYTLIQKRLVVSRLQDLCGRRLGGGGRGDPAGLPVHHLPGSPRGAAGRKGCRAAA